MSVYIRAGLIIGLLLTLFSTVSASSGTINQRNDIVNSIPQSENKPLAVENDLPCYSLDVVFIIDQSGSMGGDPGTWPNDPTGQRAYGPRWAIDFLADNALNICPDAFHRISVISFGNNVEVDLDLSDINPDNSEEWRYIRGELKKPILEKDLGDTDPAPAFEKAKLILDGAANIGNKLRKRVIIFMTDGMPCVIAKGCVNYPTQRNSFDFYTYARNMKNQVDEDFPFSANLLKQEKCLEVLRNTYGNENIPTEKSQECMVKYRVTKEDYLNSTYIYTLLISFGSAWPKSLHDIYSDMSTSHGGKAIDITENRKDIPANFLGIMTQLAGVPVTRLSCGNFAVNPFVSQARLTFFKLDENLPVTISYKDKDGHPHEVTDGIAEGGFDIQEHYLEGANERYVFDAPYAGIWSISADKGACEGIDAYYEMIKLDLNKGSSSLRLWNADTGFVVPEGYSLPEYDIQPFYNEDKAFYLTYEMIDMAGNVVRDTDYPALGAKVVATITQPNQTKQTLNLSWSTVEKIFKSDMPILVPEPGDYTISMVGTIPYKAEPYGPVDPIDPSKVFDQERELFRVEGIKINVFDVTPLKLVIDSPVSNEVLNPIHQPLWLSNWKLPFLVNPIQVKMHFVKEDGTPVDHDSSIMIDPIKSIIAQVVKDGLKSDEIYLAPDAAVPGGFVGQVENFTGEDIQQAYFKVVGEYDVHFRFIVKEEQVSFSRVDGWFNNENTYKIALGVLVAYAVFLIIKFIVDRINPVSGTLLFSISGAPSDDINLRGKNKVRFGPRKFKNKEYLDVYLVQVENITEKKRSRPHQVDDDIYIVNDDSGPVRKVRVKMCLISEKKGLRGLFNMLGLFTRWDRNYEMLSGDSNDYSQESMASVKYQG